MIVKFPLKTAVIDDDPSSLVLLAGLLSSVKEIDAKTFERPEDALEQIREDDFKLVITDISMPAINGSDLLREVASLRKGIVGVVVTNKYSIIDSHACFQDGAWHYILKPISREQIFSVIREVLAHFERWNGIFQEVSSHRNKSSFDSQSFNAIDITAILRTVDGDKKLIREISKEFVSSCPELMSRLQVAIQSENMDAVEKVAHQLRGSASNFHARRIVDLAVKLELLGQSQNTDGMSDLHQNLEVQLALMLSELKVLCTDEDLAS